jgi:stringent starvation protein B
MELSTKPYFIRAIYEWCADSGFTPYLSVKVDEHTKVPMAFVKDGEITLNISMSATRHLTIERDFVQFSARFGGVSQEVSVPIERVSGIFARENGHGAFFQVEEVGARPDSEADVSQLPPMSSPTAQLSRPQNPAVSIQNSRLAVVQPVDGVGANGEDEGGDDQQSEEQASLTSSDDNGNPTSPSSTPSKPKRPSLTVVK